MYHKSRYCELQWSRYLQPGRRSGRVSKSPLEILTFRHITTLRHFISGLIYVILHLRIMMY